MSYLAKSLCVTQPSPHQLSFPSLLMNACHPKISIFPTCQALTHSACFVKQDPHLLPHTHIIQETEAKGHGCVQSQTVQPVAQTHQTFAEGWQGCVFSEKRSPNAGNPIHRSLSACIFQVRRLRLSGLI